MKPFLIASLIIILPSLAFAEDLEMINRPVNTGGLTGLLFTTAPFTIPTGAIETASGVSSENSAVPDYIVTEVPALSVTVGIAEGMELALKGSYMRKSSNDGSIRERGAGDTELSYKWNFLPQPEGSLSPSLALIATAIAPTNNRDLNVSSVIHWGARLGLSAGSEMILGEHVLGAYIDGQIAVHDLSDERYKDRYGIMNAGVLLPISKSRNLQMLVEYNLTTGIDRVTSVGGDYSGITYGIRLVSERFNLTIGTQFLRKEASGFDKSTRVVGMASIKIL